MNTTIFVLFIVIHLFCTGQCDDSSEAKLRFYHSTFHKFSELTIDKAQDIFLSDWYNSSRSTVIFTHGFTGYPEGPAVTAVISGYLRQNKSNVVLLNWDKLAAGKQPGLVNAYFNWGTPNAKQLGPRLADTLQALSASGLNLNTTQLIGHSLGAHIVGIAGNVLRQRGVLLPWITGLDPAGVGFAGKPPSMRLNPDSADYVEVIHTDPSKYGFPRQTGTVDFWPNFRNGAVKQPGCERSGPMFSPEDICNHDRCWQLLVDSLDHPGTILGSHAKNYRTWKNNSKEQKNYVILEIGTLPAAEQRVPGNYYFNTASESPYGLEVNGL